MRIDDTATALVDAVLVVVAPPSLSNAASELVVFVVADAREDTDLQATSTVNL